MSNTFEHILAFPDEPTAQSDPIVGKWWNADAQSWDMSVCIPGLKCRDMRTDVMNPDGSVTMTYIPGFWLCIGLDHVDPALRNHSAMKLVADHDAREIQHVDVSVWCIASSEPIADVAYFMITP